MVVSLHQRMVYLLVRASTVTVLQYLLLHAQGDQLASESHLTAPGSDVTASESDVTASESDVTALVGGSIYLRRFGLAVFCTHRTMKELLQVYSS